MTTLDLNMTSGDDLILEITVKDRGLDEPVNLTGSSARFVIAPRRSKRLLVEKLAGAGTSIVDVEAGILEVELIAADTASLNGIYAYELQLTDVAGNRTTPLHGAFTIRPDLIEA